MDRRGFLKLLASGAVGAAVDVDKLLWIPGAKTIFLPPAPAIATPDDAAFVRELVLGPGTTPNAGWMSVDCANGLLKKGDVITIEGRYAVNPITRQSTGRLQEFVVADTFASQVTLHPHLQLYIDANRLLNEAESKRAERIRQLPATSYQPRRPMPFHKADPRSGWHGRR